jgi:hypothetical protein
MGLGEESNHRMARKPVLEFSKQYMGARNRAGMGLSDLPAWLLSQAELVFWNLFLGFSKVK